MRDKLSIGLLFLGSSIAFLLISFNPTISGGVININTGISPIFVAGLIFFILALAVFISRQTLEAIIIPTGTLEADILRTDTAVKEREKLKKTGYFVISGYYPHGNLEGIRKSQDYRIYKRLREYDPKVIPAEMMVEGQSHDTLENTLYSLKKIKQRAEKEGRTGALDVGIVTYPDHFKRFKDFYKKAVERGLIGKGDFRLHEIPTPETEEDRKYEANPLRHLSHQFKLATMGRYRSERGGIKQAEPSPVVKVMNKLRDMMKK